MEGMNIIKANTLNKRIRRRVITFSLVLVSIILLSGLAACSTSSTGASTATSNVSSSESDAVKVVKNHFEALKNNDYEAWKSTLWPAEKNEQNFTPSFEKPGDLGVISLSIQKVEVSPEETQREKERYTGSELAQSYHWSNEYIAENMIVVYTKYTVDYDNTKVPYQEGTLAQYSILIRDDKNSPWLIWDSCGTAD